MSTKILTSSNFDEEVLKSTKPVIVDFYADWCGPCRMVGPVMENLAEKYSGSVKVCKLNVDFAHDIAGRYGIQSIPTVLMFKGGKQVDGFLGALPAPQIESFIKKHIS